MSANNTYGEQKQMDLDKRTLQKFNELNSVPKEAPILTKQSTEVSDAFNLLEQVVSELSVNLDHLERKLQPVLHPYEGTPPPEFDFSEVMDICPLARALRNEDFRIGLLRDRIEHLVNLIEV